MYNTIQLYTDENNEVKGYPITTPDRVLDENGKSVKEKMKNNVKFNVVGKGTTVPPINGGNSDLSGEIDKIKEQVENIINKEDTSIEVIERVTKQEIDRHIKNGTVIADKSIDGLKIKDGAITIEKLNSNFKMGVEKLSDEIIIPGNHINIFDKTKGEDGWLLIENGTLNKDTPGHDWTSDYLPCIPGETIRKDPDSSNKINNQSICFYNDNKTFISGITLTTSDNWKSFIVPSNAYFFRFDMLATHKNTEKIYANRGIGIPATLNDNIKIKTSNIIDIDEFGDINNIKERVKHIGYSINDFPRLSIETDDSPRIQRAIDYISKNGGGGELLLNTAEQYDINNYLYIKRNVMLKGSDISNGLETLPQFNIYVGKNDISGKSAITLDMGACVKNLRFFYPEQVRGDESTPVEYSYTISSDSSVIPDDIRLENLMLINPYQGISLEGAGRFYLNNIYSDPIYKGLHIDKVYDVSRMEHIHFWDFNYNYAPGLREWKQANRIGYELLHIDQLSAIDCFIVGSRIGFYIGEEFWGDLTNCICDFAEKPLYIHECDMLRVSGGSFITNSYKNPIITTSNDIKGRALFTNVSMFGGASVDVLISSNTGKVSFNNCDFKKGELITVHKIPTNGYRFSPIVVEGVCEVIINGCPGINKSMIIGKENVIVDGIGRVKNGSVVLNDNFNMTVWNNNTPKNWTKNGQGQISKIENGIEIDVSPMNTFTTTNLEYNLNPNMKFSGKIYNIEFDYELIEDNTPEIELSFSINNEGYDKPCGNYTGIKTPLNCNKKIHVCLPFYLGAYLNQPKFMISVRTLHDSTTGKFRVTNLSIHEIERKSLSKNEFDAIVKDIFIDSYDNGNITLEFGKNITVKAYNPDDITDSITGDRIVNIEPSVGKPKSWIYIDNKWVSEGNL